MIITNKTKVNIHFDSGFLKPNETREREERGFDTVSIHSEIGSVEIITEYCQRKFKNYGKLVGKEGRKKDENGLKNIIITAIE